MLFIIEPWTFISYFSGSFHVKSLFTMSTIIFHFAWILISIRVFYKAFNKIIIIKRSFKLCSVIQFQTAFSFTFILCPATIVTTLFIIINPNSMLLIIYPFSIIKGISIICISSFTILHAILPIAFIYWLISG